MVPAKYTVTLAVLVSVMAPLMNTIQHLPQLHKIMKTKRVKDVSRSTLILLLVAEILWLMHGWFSHDMPLMISCGIGVLVIMTIFILHHIYEK
jgi:MtN3 and saliva related transmembrane protein